MLAHFWNDFRMRWLSSQRWHKIQQNLGEYQLVLQKRLTPSRRKVEFSNPVRNSPCLATWYFDAFEISRKGLCLPEGRFSSYTRWSLEKKRYINWAHQKGTSSNGLAKILGFDTRKSLFGIEGPIGSMDLPNWISPYGDSVHFRRHNYFPF